MKLALLALIAGCRTAIAPEDTGGPCAGNLSDPAPSSLDDWALTCATGRWSLALTVGGSPSSVLVDLYGADRMLEIAAINAGPVSIPTECGTLQATSFTVDGAGTGFGCEGSTTTLTDQGTEATLVVRVYDSDGTFSDCAATGPNGVGVVAGTFDPTWATPSAPEQLASCHQEPW